MQKKNLRFVKEYKIDSKRTKKNKERALKKLSFENSDDEKSIESIN